MTITTRTCEPQDLADIYRIYSSPQVYLSALSEPYPTQEMIKKLLDLPREHGLGIVAEIDGKVVGIIGISRFQPSSMRHVVAFSLATDVEYQNKGVGSQLMKTAIKYSFDYINAMRIEIDVAADNEIAQHLYEKFGFEHEGSKRKAAFKDGRYIDTKIMSLINDKLIGSDP